MHELLTTEEMAEAERRAVALGVPSLTLMENAGRAVADEAAKMVGANARIAVLCGPGNNGGDGFVAARILKERGFDVRVALLGDRAALKGDATEMARLWRGEVAPLCPKTIEGAALVIDAIFGAGLNRDVPPQVGAIAAALRETVAPLLAVDVPSGLNGNSGAHNGPAVQAARTITFFRKKPGHVLLPGRVLCGEVIVADIGIPEGVLERALTPVRQWDEGGSGFTFENTPALWLKHFPWPSLDGHKFSRGHALVVSGPAHQTGAARLAARGALRIGAGLVTVASPPSALPINAAHLTAIMLTPFGSARELAEILADDRKNAVVIGPGCGVGADTRDLVEAVLASGASVVLDADALTSFESTDDPCDPGSWELDGMIHEKQCGEVVLTPHQGEFDRLFGKSDGEPTLSKLELACAAAQTSHAVVVLKGPDTVIADPDGRASINANAPPTLATAGSGDVLAGFITGLLAEGMPAFEAACAAVWLHGECANTFGVGLIAEDLPEVLPRVLTKLRENQHA